MYMHQYNVHTDIGRRVMLIERPSSSVVTTQRILFEELFISTSLNTHYREIFIDEPITMAACQKQSVILVTLQSLVVASEFGGGKRAGGRINGSPAVLLAEVIAEEVLEHYSLGLYSVVKWRCESDADASIYLSVSRFVSVYLSDSFCYFSKWDFDQR